MSSQSGNVIPNLFLPIIGHMINIENFQYKVGDIFIFWRASCKLVENLEELFNKG